MIKRLLTLILGIVAMAIPAVGAETATQVVTRSAELLKRSTGITAVYTIQSNGQTMKGNLKSSGSRFSIICPGFSTWYDGKSMWTYNPRTEETTVTTPTRSELAETNPLAIISSNSNAYTAAYAKKQPADGRKVILTPRKRSGGIRSVAITFGKTNYNPMRIEITPTSGKPTILTINSLSTKAKVAAADFKYPKNKYPKATLVDLR